MKWNVALLQTSHRRQHTSNKEVRRMIFITWNTCSCCWSYRSADRQQFTQIVKCIYVYFAETAISQTSSDWNDDNKCVLLINGRQRQQQKKKEKRIKWIQMASLFIKPIRRLVRAVTDSTKSTLMSIVFTPWISSDKRSSEQRVRPECNIETIRNA